jgi:2-methylaconitate isomerase
MKNMIPDVKDGKVTVRAFSTNTQKMMYMTLDVLNGEARVEGDTAVGGVPGTGAEILVDFRDQGGGFTGETFPTGSLVDTVTLSDGSVVDVSIMDMVNICGFFDAKQFGIGCTGLELPAPDGSIIAPPGSCNDSQSSGSRSPNSSAGISTRSTRSARPHCHSRCR